MESVKSVNKMQNIYETTIVRYELTIVRYESPLCNIKYLSSYQILYDQLELKSDLIKNIKIILTFRINLFFSYYSAKVIIKTITTDK